MPVKQDYEKHIGQTTPSGLLILQVLPINAHAVRKLYLRCHCGREFSAPIGSVLRDERKSCGCRGRKPSYTENG
jgi:hypothetical protein